jgi:hypothetical protein
MIVETQEESMGISSIAGIVIGIILVALLFAGMLSWMNSRKVA